MTFGGPLAAGAGHFSPQVFPLRGAALFRLHPGEALSIVSALPGLPGLAPMPEETPQQADDRRLLAQIVAGKPDAFAALYDRLSGPLYNLCLRMVGDAEEAEDILQEAFLTIWRRADTYDPARSSVFGWAVHLTRCKAIDHLRSRGRRLRVMGPAPEPQGGNGGSSDPATPREAVAATPSASDNADLHDQAARVRRELNALPAEQSQVIELAFFSDLTHHEISARLDQPLGTIKARIRRGLLKLRDGLKGT